MADASNVLRRQDVEEEMNTAFNTLRDTNNAALNKLIQGCDSVVYMPEATYYTSDTCRLLFNVYLRVMAHMGAVGHTDNATTFNCRPPDNAMVFSAGTDALPHSMTIASVDHQENRDMLDYYISRVVCLNMANVYRVGPMAYFVLESLTKHFQMYGRTDVVLVLEGEYSYMIPELILPCPSIGELKVDFTLNDDDVSVDQMPVTSIHTIVSESNSHNAYWNGEPHCHPSTLRRIRVNGEVAPRAGSMDEYWSKCSELRELDLDFELPSQPWSLQSLRSPHLVSIYIGSAPSLSQLPPLQNTCLQRFVIGKCPQITSIPAVPPTLTCFCYEGVDGSPIEFPVESLSQCHLEEVNLVDVKIPAATLGAILANSHTSLVKLSFWLINRTMLTPSEFARYPEYRLDTIVPACRSLRELRVGLIPQLRLGVLARCPDLRSLHITECPNYTIHDLEYMLNLTFASPRSRTVDAIVARNSRLAMSAQTLLQVLIWQNRIPRRTHRVPDEIWQIIFRLFF